MKSNIPRVLILSPSFDLIGGVANHYLGLKSFWTMDIQYEFYGKRKKLPAFLTMFWDVPKYLFKLIFKRPDIIIINPSLRRYQLIRDGVYLLIANFLSIRVVTFLHGWDRDLAIGLYQKPYIFKWTYNKSKLIYVLAEEFRNDLLKIGITTKIKLTTTKVNDNLLVNFDPSSRNGEIKEILFLARILEQKGIFITINAFKILSLKYPFLKLRIVGDGPDLENAKNMVATLNLKNVTFKGAIVGMEISNEFKNAQLYILPSYEEGMPTSVLEAMSFGMPIVTRPVGGLNDFFQDKKMGRLINSFKAIDFASAIEVLIENKNITKEIANYNYKYANEHFLASKVAKRIETEIQLILSKA